jgi:hypothetical protein
MVNEMKPIGNLDPSRGIETADNDKRAGGHDDPAGPRGSADADGWPHAAAGAAPGRGIQHCNIADRDRNTRRSKTLTGNPDCDKTSAGEQLPREPPSALAGGF